MLNLFMMMQLGHLEVLFEGPVSGYIEEERRCESAYNEGRFSITVAQLIKGMHATLGTNLSSQ